MIPKRIASVLVVAMFVLCIGFTADVKAGPLGLLGRSNCSNGQCSSNYSATEAAVEPELASIAPHGVHWQLAESRSQRKEHAMSVASAVNAKEKASAMVLAYRASKIQTNVSAHVASNR